eukprot:7354632-Prymnesium_polylepis.1
MLCSIVLASARPCPRSTVAAPTHCAPSSASARPRTRTLCAQSRLPRRCSRLIVWMPAHHNV